MRHPRIHKSVSIATTNDYQYNDTHLRGVFDCFFSSCPVPFDSKALLFEDPDSSIISLPKLPPEPEPLMDWYESDEVSETLETFVKDHLTKTWQKNHS